MGGKIHRERAVWVAGSSESKGKGARKKDCPSPAAHHTAHSVLLMPWSHTVFTVKPFSHLQISSPFCFPAKITLYPLQVQLLEELLGKKCTYCGLSLDSLLIFS